MRYVKNGQAVERRYEDGGATTGAMGPPWAAKRVAGATNARTPQGRPSPGQGCASVSAQLGSAPGSMPNTERPSV